MIFIGNNTVSNINVGNQSSNPNIYIGQNLVWSPVPNAISFIVNPANALIRQNEVLEFSIETSETATFNWYDSEGRLIQTGTKYSPAVDQVIDNTFTVTAIVDGEERNSKVIQYSIQSSLPVVTDVNDTVTLTLEFVGENIDIYHFLEYQPFNTMSFPRNTIVNGVMPVLPDGYGYSITPQYHTVLMDSDKTITFTISQ